MVLISDETARTQTERGLADRLPAAPIHLVLVGPFLVDNEPGERGILNATRDKRGESHMHHGTKTQGIAIIPRVQEETTTTAIGTESDMVGIESMTVTRVVRTMIGVIVADLGWMIEGRDGRVDRGPPGRRIGEMSIASATEIEIGKGIIVGSCRVSRRWIGNMSK